MPTQPKAEKFTFVSFEMKPQEKKAVFDYEIGFANSPALSFRETIAFPEGLEFDTVPPGLLENILQDVHLMLGISYYKLYCPPKMVLSRKISKAQADFWNTIYRKGLGEFFYQNRIDSRNLIDFPCDENLKTEAYPLKRKNRILLGIGGGKDSVVAGELLKKNGDSVTALLIETQKDSSISDAVVKEMGVPSLKIRRYLDEKIFAPHEGSYNGHVPVSAIFAFLGYLAAAIYDFSYVAVGNEFSSNFGNAAYLGEEVNHQWSKSMEFEKLFQDYARQRLSSGITYFSLPRPFYEIRIAEMFAHHKKYFPYFSSCNRSFKVHKERQPSLWCCECAKCAFVFTLLSAFLPKKELLEIFGKNMFEDENLIPMFGDILGFGEMKPFDCVGTFDESRAALSLASRKFKESIIVKEFLPKIESPEKLTRDVMKTNNAPTLPAKFRLLGIKNVLILGYGKEGKVTEKYLRKYFSDLKIGIADKELDEDYLEKQSGYDLAIKTPGIRKELLTIPYVTATNLFFSNVKNTTIGITGSKGKSTTSSLIYSILKEAGKKVSLLGNIGKPMLESLMVPVDPDEIFVLELSSYQLDDIEYSPSIAVALNLFPEHMNYHDGVDNYYAAKKNIISFQKPGDIFIYNGKDERLVAWESETAAKGISFSNISLFGIETSLLGEHNKNNIRAAIATAKQFGISDDVIMRAIKKFKPLAHRLEPVGEFKGIRFYDDAISTTPESTIMAIKTIPHVGTIFLGGEDRGYDFSELEKEIRKNGIKNIVLFPDSGKRIFASREELNILETKDMQEAVAFAYANTASGDACLLSTASPSYSLWKNFEEKGDQFQHWVRQLGE
ncbi:MAG: UDP-N-acetylmuramoyl-L-alanine--D-glutamate ligase [Candidatus Moranbacteria bacterium]|nr:UDP-N-acetylmuramoyl-L-alanine--D-glutamate ligase [Candidatus Moranbacteria bacterium]